MSRTSASTDVTDQFVARRLLLEAGLAKYEYPNQLLIAAVDDTGSNATCAVRLSIVAPGMELGQLEEIRRDLVDRLRAAIRPITMGDDDLQYNSRSGEYNREPDHENDWVYKVAIEPHFHSGEPQVVVTMNDPQYLDLASAPAVLGYVRGILTPVAKSHWRQLVLLDRFERLVPLPFQVEDLYRRSITVELPAELKLVQTRRPGGDYDENPVRRACNAFEHTLRVVLGLDTWVEHTSVSLSRQGAISLQVDLNRRVGTPSAVDLNRIQWTVCQVVAMHASVEGYYSQLVIRPAREEHDLLDGDYDEDAGFLGEHTREY